MEAEAALSAERLARFDQSGGEEVIRHGRESVIDQGGGGSVLPHGRHIDQDVTLADPRYERRRCCRPE